MADDKNRFRVERSIVINAPANRIAPLILDFHNWLKWSPFDRIDPEQQRTYSGAASGVGAVYAWSGKKAGAGRMEVIAVQPDLISIQLDFSKPMTSHNQADFLFEPAGAGQKVTWAMHGPKTLMSRVMGVFMSMDSLVGKDFEKGLADLKAAAEGTPTA